MNSINTALGLVNPDNLGITLYHEHLAMTPGPATEFASSIFDDTDKILTEVNEFKDEGGGTFVEMSPLNFGRNVKAYQEISKKSGVNVICCTGFHRKKFLPDWIESISAQEIENRLIREITEGMDDTDVKAGVIKIGTSLNEILPIEKRVIEIVAEVHQATGVPISSHCEKGSMALEQGAILEKSHVSPDRVLLGHVDIPNDLDYLLEICKCGFNVGIDHVGRDLVNNDQRKIDLIKALIEKGFIAQIFISGDMGKKEYLRVYGGNPGFRYIVREFKASLLKNGISEKQYNQILIENPKRLFTPKLI